MQTFEISGNRFMAVDFIDGVLIDPLVPERIEDETTDKSPLMPWVNMQYIRTYEADGEKRYEVRGFDTYTYRHSSKGEFSTLEEALKNAKKYLDSDN